MYLQARWVEYCISDLKLAPSQRTQNSGQKRAFRASAAPSGCLSSRAMARDSSSRSKHLYVLVNGKKSGDEGLRAAIKSIRWALHYPVSCIVVVSCHLLTVWAAGRRGTRSQ